MFIKKSRIKLFRFYNFRLTLLMIFILLQTLIISVNTVQAFCVKLDPNPKTIIVKPGESVNVTIGVSTAVNIDYGTEVFKATGLPLYTDVKFTPSTIPYKNGYQGTAYLTIKTSQNTPEGTYQVTIHLIGSGPDSGEGNTATITLIVSSTSQSISTTTQTSISSPITMDTFLYVIISILIVLIIAIIILKRR